MSGFADAEDDILDVRLLRMKLTDDEKHDIAESSASQDFTTSGLSAQATFEAALSGQIKGPGRGYMFQDGKTLVVKATTLINEKDIPVCQICHHLNPDFVESNDILHASWARREFKNSSNIRSCSFDISNTKYLVDSAKLGCRYCDLLCTALTTIYPNWESKESFIDVYLAWDLPIVFKFQHGTRHKHMASDDVNRLLFNAPGLEPAFDASQSHFVSDFIESVSDDQFLEIYKPQGSPIGQSGCFPSLCHLGFAPERFENLDAEHSYKEMKRVIEKCRSGTGEHGTCLGPSPMLPRRFLGDYGSYDSGRVPRRLLYLGTQTNPIVKIVPRNDQVVLYNALSYRWGNQEFLKTKKSNLKQFQDQILWKDLPPLFQDAITISRNLEISYLWIDALCIIQDDKEDWKEQAPQMGSIYYNSYATIACASAASPSERILGPRSSLWQSKSFEIKDEENRNIELRVRQRSISPETGKRDQNPDYLATRAWIWQERLLSRRSLVFTKSAMRFECHVASVWEDQLYAAYSFSSRLDKDPRTYWNSLIEDFTEREITVSTDRLPAIQAVMNKLMGKHRLTPICGLWLETITTNLHWIPKNGLHSLKPHASYVAPTWSWASMEGAIEWSIGLADGLPEEDKQWDLKLVDIEYPSFDQAVNSHPIRDTLWLEGRFVRGTVVREKGRHAVVFHDTSSYHDFIPDVELVPVDPVPRMAGYHFSTRRRRFGEVANDGDWKGQCGCLLLVRMGQSGTSLVVAPSKEDPRYCERLGVLLHHPIVEFLRLPRRVIQVH